MLYRPSANNVCQELFDLIVNLIQSFHILEEGQL